MKRLLLALVAVALLATLAAPANAYSKYSREQRSDWFNTTTLTLHTTLTPSPQSYKVQLLASTKYTYKHKPGHKAKVKVRKLTVCITFTTGHLPPGDGTPGGLIGIDFTPHYYDSSGQLAYTGEVFARYRADHQTCAHRKVPKSERVWMRMVDDPRVSIRVGIHYRISRDTVGFMVASSDGRREKLLLPAYDHPGVWGVSP